MRLPIHVQMASWKPRIEGMLKRVKEILPQLSDGDSFTIWLNGYDTSIYDRLPKDKKLEVILAGEGRVHPDIKSHGKFMFMEKWTNHYYATIDDDILYPSSYIIGLIAGVNRYDGKAIVSFHGGTFPLNEDGSIAHLCPRRVCNRRTFEMLCQTDEQVHILGNGIMCCIPSKIGLTYTLPTNPLEGDDETIALWAQRNKVPLIRLAHFARWIRNDVFIAGTGALCMNSDHVIAVDRQILSWKKWHLPKIGEK